MRANDILILLTYNYTIWVYKEKRLAWKRQWSDVNIAPYNPITDKAYRGCNSLWLQLQGHSDPRWLVFNQTKDEKGISKKALKVQIEYWMFNKEVNAKYEKGKVLLKLSLVSYRFLAV